MRKILTVAALAAPLGFAQPALAAPAAPKFGAPVQVGDGFTLDPIIDARLRWEHVDQPTTDADAVTLRLRAGVELKHVSGLSLLVEGEGTLAIGADYNAFPFAVAVKQRRPQFSTIPDPENIDLNRAQIQYKSKAATLTLGRQRINIDDQRWVGSVGWRQNEQTFDAVRGEAKLGPVALDATYAISQRTIFGIDAGRAADFAPGTGPRQHYKGDFVFLNATGKLGPINLRAFSYLLDYDPSFFLANSSQTYGGKATGSFALAKKVKLNLMASYARQSDYGKNPVNYAADYIAGEAGLAVDKLTLTGGYEELGSDRTAAAGASRAVQTPMATLHKLNGWADMFLTTPNKGLRDYYAGVAYKFDGVKALPGLNAAVIWHKFDSDIGHLDYGDEWDASLGFKVKQVAILAKYANYKRHGAADFAGDQDTEKFWLQAEVSF
ncbi:alginate export family protein [Novosphingobium sp. G106]|uniref:alginate export family protein n=1 Tax=Novosphingobium sp. G106 TaxID=2849500 RepID=UPI001C2CE013|nr:alginate export family protein [Novosphingobium sp. G106]MBV1688591.1 alginate export family protein [Novosphingobium sp. G106]